MKLYLVTFRVFFQRPNQNYGREILFRSSGNGVLFLSGESDTCDLLCGTFQPNCIGELNRWCNLEKAEDCKRMSDWMWKPFGSSESSHSTTSFRLNPLLWTVSELKRQNFFRVHGQYAMADFLSWILPWVLILLCQGFNALKTSFLFFFFLHVSWSTFLYPYVQVMVNLFKYYLIISQQTK